jgi:hypothetical protein
VIYTQSVLGHRNDALGAPSAGQIFFQGISRYIPYRILEYLGETSKNPRILRIREAETLATSFAKEMVKDKAEILLQGKSSRDVFSLLGGCTASLRSSKSDEGIVKANMDTDAKAKLTEEELIAQMRWVHNIIMIDCNTY